VAAEPAGLPRLPRRTPADQIRSTWLFHDRPANGVAAWRPGTCNITHRTGEDSFNGDADLIDPGTQAFLMIEQVTTPAGGIALIGWGTYRRLDGHSTDMR